MKLSTKSEYGVRAMVDLALHLGTGPVAVGDISKREGISIYYLEQILNRLRRKGLVKSVRGPRGGYILAKKPDKIKIGVIVEILEDGIMLTSCIVGKKRRTCDRIGRCVTKLVWDRLNESIKNALNSFTIADLLKEADKLGINKSLKHDYTFHI